MDNLTHTLCGALLAKTRLGRLSPLAPAALLLGANLPDLDIAVALFGDEAARKAAYLIHHRGITHSLAGIVVQALLLAAAVRWIERREFGGARPPWHAHLVPAAVALLTHPLLDLLNNYGVRPWLPFATTRWHGDLIFIVDPWLWLLFGGTAALAGARTRAGSVVWGAVAVAATLFLLGHERTPAHLRVAFPAAIVWVAVARARGVGAATPRRVLAAGAALVAGYLALTAACAGRIDARLRAVPAIAQALRMRSPAIADPFHGSVALVEGGVLTWRPVDWAGRLGESRAAPLALGLDDPLVAAAGAKPEALAWRTFARLPWGWVVARPDGGADVHLADARYCTTRDADSWCAIRVELSAAEVAAATLPP